MEFCDTQKVAKTFWGEGAFPRLAGRLQLRFACDLSGCMCVGACVREREMRFVVTIQTKLHPQHMHMHMHRRTETQTGYLPT